MLQLRTRLAIAALVAAPLAQADGGITDLGNYYGAAMGGYVIPDHNRDASHGSGWHLLLGYRVTPSLSAELNGQSYISQHETDTLHDFLYRGGIDLRYTPFAADFSPYVLGGLGLGYEDVRRVTDYSGYADLGVGALLQLPIQNLSLRGEVREYAVFRDNSAAVNGTLYDTRLNLGVELAFAGVAPAVAAAPGAIQDSDNDGVIDSHDRCPGTPAHTEVDGHGCPLPLDSDHDGVDDTRDECPLTPAGTPVDDAGCPQQGAVAPAEQAPVPVDGDADQDGVKDSADACPNTPAGVAVDVTGCPVDQDNDGVPNAEDKCPDTPAGMKVDARGCVVQQTLVLHNVNFEMASSTLTEDAEKTLDGIAAGLLGQPGMEIEIGGHTDSLGPQAYNLTLSQARAKAVRDYLLSKGVDGGRLTAEGYGEFNPIADNNTAEGRSQNRRVEFKVIKQ